VYVARAGTCLLKLMVLASEGTCTTVKPDFEVTSGNGTGHILLGPTP